MKKIFVLVFMVLSLNAHATCSSPISRTSFSPNTVILSTLMNTQFNTVYNKVNDLDGDCITDSSIETAKLADLSVTKAKLATGAVANITVSAKTSDYTVTTSDDLITVDATTGTKTMTLPSAVSNSGKTYIFKKTDSSTNTVVIDGNLSETIDGATTVSLFKQYQQIKIVSNGTNWYIIEGHKCSSAAACAPVLSAKISSTGVVSDENADFINSDCTNANPRVCTFVSSTFTVTPNCVAIFTTNQAYGQITAASSTSISIQTYTDSGGAVQHGAYLVCTKTGADYAASKP